MATNHAAVCEDRSKALHNYATIITAEQVGAWGSPQTRIYEKLIDDAYREYCECHRALMAPEMGDRAAKAHTEQKQKLERVYVAMSILLHDRLEALQPVVNVPLAPVAAAEPQVICVEARKDPRVGTFDGTPQDWLSFRDLFMAEVVNRQDLPAITKLRYLQEACVKKAADALGPWERTDQNFEPAWAMLKERYDDEFPIRQGLIQKIFALPATSSESFDGLSRAINVVQGALRQLNAMNVQTDQWDPMIIHLLTQRLPPLTMDMFEQRRAAGDIPSLKALLDFVQGRARGRMYIDQADSPKLPETKPNPISAHDAHTSQSNGKNRPLKKGRYEGHNSSNGHNGHNGNGNGKPPHERNRPSAGAGSSAYPPCKKCNGEHALYRCTEFLNVPLQKRTELIDLWGHCRNCMRQHGPGLCTLSGCTRCPGEMHNQVLCPQGKYANAQVNHIQHGKGKKRSAGQISQ